jgi:hypothetical protein
MARRLFPALLWLLSPVLGCADLSGFDWDKPLTASSAKDPTPPVTANPFAPVSSDPKSMRSLSCPPATAEAATRVGMVGQKVLNANPQLGIRPLFMTIGAPSSEVFHQGSATITITEGLVKQCNSDGQLAAVLCSELGKIMAEREIASALEARKAPRYAPMDVRVGNDYAGPFGPADRTDLADQLKVERDFATQAPLNGPDPRALAQAYLVKAGFGGSELDAVAPLLRATEKNTRLETQLNGGRTDRGTLAAGS